MDKEDKLPTPTVVVEAQPWPKGHIAKIASVRTSSNKNSAKRKIVAQQM